MKPILFLVAAISLVCSPVSSAADDNPLRVPPSDVCGPSGPKPCLVKILTPPKPLHIVKPDYPMVGRKKKHGSVHLEAIITASGDVRDVRVEDGGREVAQAAAGAVRKWRYSPATVNGVPVEFTHEVTVDFAKDGISLGPDDLSVDLPLQPSEDLIGMLRRGELYLVGGTVKPPRAVYSPDPDYPEPARKANYAGLCKLSLIVGSDGKPRSIWVTRPIGYGLDERAIDAVNRWKFVPAMKSGTPVDVFINVEVQFRLY